MYSVHQELLGDVYRGWTVDPLEEERDKETLTGKGQKVGRGHYDMKRFPDRRLTNHHQHTDRHTLDSCTLDSNCMLARVTLKVKDTIGSVV